MPFTEINKPLLEAAASIDFQFTKAGNINSARHTKHELGLYFIKKAIEKHGNRYGYSNVEYVNTSTKTILTCMTHGDFYMCPRDHLSQKGCPLCAKNALQTTDTFIKRALAIHGNKYDYSVTQYTGALNKLDILCPIHGKYSIRADHHLSGIGCAKCSYDHLTLSTEEFIRKARNIHGDKYDYSAVKYKNNRERVDIICALHGSFFSTPTHHISSGTGCPKCNGGVAMSQEDFLRKAQEVHGDKYDYRHAQYKSMHEKINILCPEHKIFQQTPSSHIHQGAGCPLCAGKNHDILYLLKCSKTGWYKIGITTDNVQKRLTSLGGNLKKVHHVVLEDPRKHESILHNKYKGFNVYHDGVRSGKTEFFSLNEQQVQEVISYMNEVSNA